MTVFVFRSFAAGDPAAEPPAFDVLEVDLDGVQGFGGDVPGSSPNPGGLLGQVWIVSDHSDGPSRGEPLRGCVASTRPERIPWTSTSCGRPTAARPGASRLRIHADDRGAWQWFATMSVAPNGRIDVVWVESLERQLAEHRRAHLLALEGRRDSWSTPIAVSPPFDSWLGWPQQDKLGDYYHMVSDAVGAHLA